MLLLTCSTYYAIGNKQEKSVTARFVDYLCQPSSRERDNVNDSVSSVILLARPIYIHSTCVIVNQQLLEAGEGMEGWGRQEEEEKGMHAQVQHTRHA